MQEFKEYSKISVHQHFGGKQKQFDKAIDDSIDKELSYDWKYTKDLLKDSFEHQFNLIAMTNQNVFNAEKFYLSRKLFNIYNIEVIPGMETNIKNKENESYLHIVILFDPEENLISLQNEIETKFNSNGNHYLEIEDLVDLTIKRKAIIIPHGLKQNQSSLGENTNLVDEFYALESGFPIMLEDNQAYHRASLIEKIKSKLSKYNTDWVEKLPSVSGGDRKMPSEISSPTYIWANNTFDDLYFCSLMNDEEGNQRIKRRDDIVRKVRYINKMVINKSNKTLIGNNEIYFSHGLNTIIGSSGSGKTLLLSIIKRKLKSEELVNSNFEEGYDSISSMDDIKIYDDDNKEILLEDIDVYEGENLYNKIIKAYNEKRETLIKEFNIDTNFSKVKIIGSKFESGLNDYIKNYKNKIKSFKDISNDLIKIKASIDFLLQNKTKSSYVINYSIETDYRSKIEAFDLTIKALEDELKQLEDSFGKILKLVSKYLKEEDATLFNELNQKLSKAIQSKLLETKNRKINEKKDSFKKNYLLELTKSHNDKLGKINSSISKQKQELINNKNNIISNLKTIQKIKRKLVIPTLNKGLIERDLDIKDGSYAKLEIKDIKLNFDQEMILKSFPANIGQRATSDKIGISTFKKEGYNLEKPKDVKNLLEVFIEKNNSESISFVIPQTDIIDYDIELKNLDGEYMSIEKITAGTLSKIYIDKMFEENLNKEGVNTIIIYDQPEANMEKEFILNELVKKFKELKNEKQIFVATHEPLLVINADSNNIIKATNDKKVGQKMSIKYENISITGSDSKSDAVKNVASLIDGSREAIKFRNKIYGGMIDENQD